VDGEKIGDVINQY